MQLGAVILAGGKSSRMGCNKAWLQYRGRPLIVRQLELVQSISPAELSIAAGPIQDYGELGYPVLADTYQHCGPVAGIHAALKAHQSELLLVLAVDMPRISGLFLRKLVAQCAEGRGIVPRRQGHLEPLTAIYPKACLRVAEALLTGGTASATRLAQLCAEARLVSFYEVSARERLFFANWNTPADLKDEPYIGD